MGRFAVFVTLTLKVFALCVFQILVRWTLPRYRYDQVMDLGWKYLLPAAVINLLVTAFVVIYFGF